MKDAFANIIDQHMQSQDSKDAKVTVTQRQYEQWAAGFVFEAMRDQRYGQSFCNRFKIHDNILFYERDLSRADAYIKRYYVR